MSPGVSLKGRGRIQPSTLLHLAVETRQTKAMEVPAQHQTLLLLHGSVHRGASTETFKLLPISGWLLELEREQVAVDSFGGCSVRPQAA